ncbi:MAG: hypothetical protein ACLTYN_15235 [Dysosmobacter welbionis]
MGGLLIILRLRGTGGAFYYIKFIKNKPKTKGDTDLDIDYGGTRKPPGRKIWTRRRGRNE